MSLSSQDKTLAAEIARDITVAALTGSQSVSYARDIQAVGEFYEAMFRKAAELLLNSGQDNGD